MRLLLTGLIFIASLAAAVFVHAARADAAWSQPRSLGPGHSPHGRAVDGRLAVAPSAAATWLHYDRSGERVHVDVTVVAGRRDGGAAQIARFTP